MLWSRLVLSPSWVTKITHVSSWSISAVWSPCRCQRTWLWVKPSAPRIWSWPGRCEEMLKTWIRHCCHNVWCLLQIFYRSPGFFWLMEQILKLLTRAERQPLMWDNEVDLLFKSPFHPLCAMFRFLPNLVPSRSYIILGKRYIAEVLKYFYIHSLSSDLLNLSIFQDGALAFEEPPGSWLKKKDEDKGERIFPATNHLQLMSHFPSVRYWVLVQQGDKGFTLEHASCLRLAAHGSHERAFAVPELHHKPDYL